MGTEWTDWHWTNWSKNALQKWWSWIVLLFQISFLNISLWTTPPPHTPPQNPKDKQHRSRADTYFTIGSSLTSEKGRNLKIALCAKTEKDRKYFVWLKRHNSTTHRWKGRKQSCKFYGEIFLQCSLWKFLQFLFLSHLKLKHNSSFGFPNTFITQEWLYSYLVSCSLAVSSFSESHQESFFLIFGRILFWNGLIWLHVPVSLSCNRDLNIG